MSGATIQRRENTKMGQTMGGRRRWRRMMGAAAAVVGVSAVFAGPAQAELTLVDFDGGLETPAGETYTQAGGHPDGETSFEFSMTTWPGDGVSPVPDEQFKDIRVDLPPGLVGDMQAMLKCDRNDLGIGYFGECPSDSQVGTVDLLLNNGPQSGVPLYALEPRHGAVAQFGFNFYQTVVTLEASIRPGDHGVTISVNDASRSLLIVGSKVRLWGVPADSSHDHDRSFLGLACFEGGEFGNPPPCPSGQPRRALLTAPTSCLGPQTTTLRARSWENWDRWVTGSFVSHDQADNPVGGTGCDRLDFGPSMTVTAGSSEPGAPTGLDVDLAFRQNMGPDALSTAHLKDAKVVLPEGMTINPSSAHGLQGCSDEQLSLDSDAPVGCPDGSKIGSVEATTPVLDETLKGGVYVGSQRSDDPESGEMFRVFLNLVSVERGLNVKLAGKVKANSQTGRLEVSFDNNPQLPVSTISVSLKSGPRAPLANPTTCGTKTVTADLSSWAGQGAALSDSFTIDCPGTGGFAPGFEAGSVSPAGGAFSPFVARIDRPDGQQFLSGLAMDLPKGTLAKLRGVPLCGSAQAESGGCPAGSRIGTATVGAGPGSSPFYVQGDMFLTVGYKGAPYGVATHVHAKAGPFDLGWVRVRQALYVDPETAQVSVVSDTLPQIVKGVPVRLRSVDVDVDRAGFTINPTSCSEKQVDATFTAIDGAVHKTGSRFQASDCQALAFTPKMRMRLSGKGQSRTGDHPAFTTILTQPKGQAGIGRAKVTMPRSIVLDPTNTADPKMLCGYDESLKADCPASSVIGKATAVTPVLNKPLTGQVHLVQGIKFGKAGNRIRTTPSLLVKLRGEVAINLRGQTTTEKGTNRLVTTFAAVPDAPVSKFTLKVTGGKKGILVVTRTRRAKIDLCAGKQVANVETTGHNGKQANYATTVKTPCGGKAAKKAKRAGGRR